MGWNPTKPTVVVMTSQQQQAAHHKARHRSEGEEVGFEWGKESRRKYCLWWGKWDSLVNRDNSNPHQVSLWPGQARELTPSISFVTIQFSLQSSLPSVPRFPSSLDLSPCRRYLRSEICLIIIIWYSVLVCINNTSDESRGGASKRIHEGFLIQVPYLLAQEY